MKEYKYHGFVFRPTTTMTEVNVLNRFRCYTTKLVPLYEIDGLKECGKHPLLTTIALLHKHGVYSELGNSWNLSVFDI